MTELNWMAAHGNFVFPVLKVIHLAGLALSLALGFVAALFVREVWRMFMCDRRRSVKTRVFAGVLLCLFCVMLPLILLLVGGGAWPGFFILGMVFAPLYMCFFSD